jgi:rhodanese-related sulfurtransferase
MRVDRGRARCGLGAAKLTATSRPPSPRAVVLSSACARTPATARGYGVAGMPVEPGREPRPPLSVDQLLAEARRGLARVGPEEAARELAEGSVLVDIRSDSQRSADGLMPDAVHVPRNVLEWRADPGSGHSDPSLGGRETRLILICNEGYQSSLAAATLQLLGRDATDVIGGFVGWRAAGLPVAQD